MAEETKRRTLTVREQTWVSGCVYVWCGLLVLVPIISFLTLPSKDLGENFLVSLLFGIPSLGLIAVAGAVAPHSTRGGKNIPLPWKFRDTAKDQFRQLSHLRNLGGVNAAIGVAYVATLLSFDQDALTMPMLTASVLWVACASVFFVAYLGIARMERPTSEPDPNMSEQ